MRAAVGDEIDERLGRYLRAGLATLTTHRHPTEGVWAFDVVPAQPTAAGICIGVGGDEVTVTVGNGSVDFWWDAKGEWRRRFGEVLEAVAGGRYHERAAKGWVFERNVRMYFSGAELAETSYARLTYDGDDETDAPPAPGVWRYPAWDAV
jgi:hypothetical protein